MKLPGSVTISGDIIHVCGQYLKYYMHLTSGVPSPMVARVENNHLTLTSYYHSPDLHFIAHGSCVKYCPGCKKLLPDKVETVNDADFKQA